MRIVERPSPNFDARDSGIEMLVMHYTNTLNTEEALNILLSPERKVSAHYVLAEDGTLFQLVDEMKRAWHAGISYWRGKENLNACSIGIEIVNSGDCKFTEEQYETLIALSLRIKKQYGLKDHNIIGHSDIAPDRKKDPGELFEWERLAKSGLGLWPNNLKPETRNLKLTDLGYREHNEASVTAFQRHWRQSNITGVWDDECCNILTNLLEQSGR